MSFTLEDFEDDLIEYYTPENNQTGGAEGTTPVTGDNDNNDNNGDNDGDANVNELVARDNEEPEEGQLVVDNNSEGDSNNSESEVDLGSLESVEDPEVEVESENNEPPDEEEEEEVPSVVLEEEEEEERLVGEFILDNDDFQYLESEEPIMLREEIELPEYKIVSTEEEQIADLMNEIMRKVPEEKREDPKLLKRIKNQVHDFIKLKEKHSLYDDKGEIVSEKMHGTDYKPIVDNVLNGIFSDKMYYPITHQSKTLYQNEQTDKEGNTTQMFEVDTRENNLVSNTQIIENVGSIRKKYKNTRLRQNYSYLNEMKELNDTFEEYSNLTDNGYKLLINDNVKAYNNCFEENDLAAIKEGLPNENKFDAHVVPKPIDLNLNGNPFDKSSSVNVTGILKYNEYEASKSKFLKKPLSECVTDNYSTFNPSKSFNTSDLIDLSAVNVVDFNITKGSLVNICLPSKDVPGKTVSAEGNVIDILGDQYVVFVPNPTEEISRIVRIKKKDSSVKIEKKFLKTQIPNVDSSCAKYNFTFYKFPEKQLSSEEFKTLLNHIVPYSHEIIHSKSDLLYLKNVVNLSEVDDILSSYELSIDTLNSELMEPIRDFLQNSNEKIIELSRTRRAKLLDLLKEKPTAYKTAVSLLNRKLLEEYREYYGIYPDYDTSIDSTERRLTWLLNTYDQGTLFFKSIILKMFGSFYKKIDTTREKINRDVESLTSSYEKLQDSIQNDLIKISREGNDCVENRFVKSYATKKDMEEDNLREIEIDEDKKNFFDRDDNDFIVKNGDFCYLESENQIYRRSGVSGGSMWILDTNLDVEKIVKSNRDFCNQFNENLTELVRKVRNEQKCFYNDDFKTCLPMNLHLKIEKGVKMMEKLTEKANLKLVVANARDYYEHLKNMQTKLQNRLKLHRKMMENRYKLEEKEYEQIAEKVVDPEFKEFYEKVDKYLTAINELPNEETYKLLDAFLKKYGRYYDSSLGESPKNIYSKIGNRILVCKHHTLLIDYYTSSEKNAETLKYIKEKWCVESESKYYCTNCGQEVFDAEYESVEGFASNGAHIVTSEVMEPTEEETEKLNEVKYIEGLLELSKDKDEINSVMDIIKTLTGLMGIRLKDIDLDYTTRKAIEVNNVVIKDKDSWLATQKKVPKNQAVIDKAYNNYKIRNIVLNTSATLFIYLQVSIPGYSIKRPHSKCRASLKGFPLENDESSTEGLTYINCLLETLRDSGSSIYDSLKKVKIMDGLMKIVKYVVKDAFIKKLLTDKIEADKLQISSSTRVQNNWNEFKPPLGKFNVPYENLEPMDPSDPNFEEHNHLLSLKVIQNIDTQIDDSQIENKMFDPVPLGNTCCSEKLDENYHFYNYFKSTGDVTPLVDTLNTMEQTKSKDFTSKRIMDRISEKIPIQKFDKEIFPIDPDEEFIKQVYVNTITDGQYIGHAHIFDELGTCIITGLSKQSLIEGTFSKEEYNSFIENYHKTRLYNKIVNERIYTTLAMLNEIRSTNDIFKTNETLQKMIDTLLNYETSKDDKSLDRMWRNLKEQINIEKDTLVSRLAQSTRKRQLNSTLEQIEQLGELLMVREDNNERLSPEESSEIFFDKKEHLISNYFNKLRSIVSNIKNKNILDQDDVKLSIPYYWRSNVNEDILNRLVANTMKRNELVKKYTEITSDNELLTKTNDSLSNYLNKNIDFSKLVLGKPNIISCDVTITSSITNENTSDILHYTFILLLLDLLNISESSVSMVSMFSGKKSSFTGDLDSDVEEDEADVMEESSANTAEEGDGGDITSAINESKMYVASLIIDFLTDITKERELLDKHTFSFNKRQIEKSADVQKEENLRFIEMLDTEARQSLKAMLTIGVDSWKNLASKNKTLYFEESEELRTDDTINMEETDLETLALHDLGENYTEEQFNQWSMDRERNMRIEREVRSEMMQMPDDDGDGVEYDSDNF